MSVKVDLQVDTDWIRRAAATVRSAAQAFGAPTTPPLLLATTALGISGAAAATAALVNLRAAQAHDAAGQLHAISAALAERLDTTAQHLDEAEASIAARPR